ncbi:MAG: tRNA uridine-5-carboxymethylaminomethyl(34) synthesis GTPase MnmE [Bacteroidales bacterium]|jgi:tRNA modification GTPase|nr:tRNA uridine-5-carboxymethylaminomethyl(34) synthesis GTPase MnmE [Bacteroidales bacterium]
MYFNDTVCAVATPAGTGGVAIVRISGSKAKFIAEKICGIAIEKPRHAYYCKNVASLDDVLLTYFKAPNSYTGEDVVEISCHASTYITSRLLELCVDSGARIARAGEFTERAFLNGRMDLAQAEAVADLIASENAASHHLALQQLRGGLSNFLAYLREQLLHLASLLELELDFSEEDLEFANREELALLLEKIKEQAVSLCNSFILGNAIKEGVPVAIIGKPNAGKSTLLNALLHEEKALVSDIPGTTRDAIEDTIVIEGVKFRFIDTAGLRTATDEVERMGVERTYEKMQNASIWLYMFDVTSLSLEQALEEVTELKRISKSQNVKVFLVGNKCDLLGAAPTGGVASDVVEGIASDVIFISAKNADILELKKKLFEACGINNISQQQVILSNARHYEILQRIVRQTDEALNAISAGLPSDLLAQHIRVAISSVSEITGGEILPDNILANIFSKFCIGK